MIHLEKEKSNKKRCVVVMFDTLCRRFLPTYNDDASWVIAPNFQRLAKRCVQFNKCYVGGMACMPACQQEEKCIRVDIVFFIVHGVH